MLFAILQKYEFSSKSQPRGQQPPVSSCCLRYCKSTSFQANHNPRLLKMLLSFVVCDTAKVRVFKQITTRCPAESKLRLLFAILQKYEFSSKSQLAIISVTNANSCLRYCKSTSFQANHNYHMFMKWPTGCLRYCKSTSFQANHNSC